MSSPKDDEDVRLALLLLRHAPFPSLNRSSYCCFSTGGGFHEPVAMMISARPFSPGCNQRLHVAVEHGFERLLCFPLRMMRRKRFHAVEGKRKLEIDWLFGPERSVVIERRDALRDRNKIRTTFSGYTADEVNNRPFVRAIVPRRQWIGLGACERRNRQEDCQERECASGAGHSMIKLSQRVWFLPAPAVLRDASPN